MTTFSFNNLVIEITKRCNMACEHCLRGDARNEDIDINHLIPLFDRTENIQTISFTGGEPSLNVKAIKDILKLVKQYKFPVSSFYLVTNGKKVTQAFLMTMLDWYAYCCKNDAYLASEACGVALSQDDFHAEIPPDNEFLLRGLGFFREDKYTNWKKTKLIDEGRANNLSPTTWNKRPLPAYTYNIDAYEEYKTDKNQNIFIDSEILITTDGKIVPGCDHSYENAGKIAICNTSQMDYFEKYISKHLN